MANYPFCYLLASKTPYTSRFQYLITEANLAFRVTELVPLARRFTKRTNILETNDPVKHEKK